jgi:anti-anti-sigma factor
MLDVVVDAREHAAVVRLIGDVDLATPAGTWRELRATLESAEPAVVLDLAEVAFTDVAAVRRLLAQLEWCRRRVPVALAGASPLVHWVVQMLGEPDPLPMAASVEEALAQVAAVLRARSC